MDPCSQMGSSSSLKSGSSQSKTLKERKVLLAYLVLSYFCFSGPHLRHMEVSQARGRIRATAAGLHHTAIAMPDPSCACDLYHSSKQTWILNPLNMARDRTRNLMVLSWIHFCCATMGTHTSVSSVYKFIFSDSMYI